MQINASLHVTGDAARILGDLRRIPSVTCDAVILWVPVKVPRSMGRYEDYYISSIKNGDGSRAREDVARLAHQCRIDRDTETALLALIDDYERLQR